jgi:hypothetical protein
VLGASSVGPGGAPGRVLLASCCGPRRGPRASGAVFAALPPSADVERDLRGVRPFPMFYGGVVDAGGQTI